jgi:hypothetical protein
LRNRSSIEEAADVEVALDPDRERVQLDAEVLGPEAVGDGLAGAERGKSVLDGIRGRAAAAERRRLVDRELSPPRDCLDCL